MKKSILVVAPLLLSTSGCVESIFVEPAGAPAVLAVSYAMNPASQADRVRIRVRSAQLVAIDTTLDLGPEPETRVRLAIADDLANRDFEVEIEARAADGMLLQRGVTTVRLTPGATTAAQVALLPTPRAARALAIGAFHTCVLDEIGAAHCWGRGTEGQLGNGGTAQTTSPVAVTGGHRFTALSAGGNSTCGLTAQGTVLCWGLTLGGNLSSPTALPGTTRFATFEVSSIAAGSGGTFSFAGFAGCGLAADSTAWCIGSNRWGNLGRGDTLPSTVPVAVGGGAKYRSLSTGLAQVCAIGTDARSYCWGGNQFLQTGTSDVTTPVVTPTLVRGGLSFDAIAAGAVISCALLTGAGYCWGTDGFGSRATGSANPSFGAERSSTPVAMVGGLVFNSIRSGRENNIHAASCGITTTGEGYCWGSNANGQLGTATQLAACAAQNPCSSRPVLVANNLRFALIVPAGSHACGITTDQKLYCWGANDAGQLGDGSLTPSPVPIQVASGLQIPR